MEKKEKKITIAALNANKTKVIPTRKTKQSQTVKTEIKLKTQLALTITD